MKNAKKNSRPSGDLIPHNMQSSHTPQQLGSEKFSAFNLYLNIYFSPAIILFY